MKTRRAFTITSLTAGRQRGLSLIELMIAMTISLLIILALIAVYLNFSRTNREMAKSNAMIDNGRFVMQLLQNDIVHAGFWGTYSPDYDNFTSTEVPGDVPDAVPAACRAYDPTIADITDPGYWTDADKNNLIGIPIQAYDAVPAGCSTVVANKKANTDVLLVRHVATCVAGVGNCEADVAGKLYFQSSDCTSDVAEFVLGDDGYNLLKRDCTAAADKRKFISNLYYIRDYAETVGDGIPALVRSQFDVTSGGSLIEPQAAVPLVEGVEGFRVELGVDSLSETAEAVDYSAAINWADETNKTSAKNRGDGTPDGAFVSCTTASPCTAAELMNVSVAKIYVLVRNLETTAGYTDTKTYQLGGMTLGPFNDHFKRHLFVTTVRLANITARRETP